MVNKKKKQNKFRIFLKKIQQNNNFKKETKNIEKILSILLFFYSSKKLITLFNIGTEKSTLNKRDTPLPPLSQLQPSSLSSPPEVTELRASPSSLSLLMTDLRATRRPRMPFNSLRELVPIPMSRELATESL